jgi:hypothetical protein
MKNDSHDGQYNMLTDGSTTKGEAKKKGHWGQHE